MGYSRPPHEISSLHPIQTGAVNKVISREVSAGDGSTAWCANQHRVRQRYQISISLLKKSSRDPGTRLKFSTAYHLQTDGQSERTIQILVDMLRACILEFKGSWEDHMHLVEFAYSNNYQSSIKMAPFEALYGRKCRYPLCWDDIGERRLLGPEVIQQIVEKVKIIREHLKAA